MNIGREGEPIIVEPLEEPREHPVEEPREQPVPVEPTPVEPVREPVPA